jgi:predicted nucleic acid-binding protein
VSRIVVCDTGPLIHLSEANAIHLLKLAGGILIPPAVATEFARNLPNEKLPDWIQVHELTMRSNSQVTRWVKNDDADIGEAAAVALALQQHSDWLLTDDAEARQFAESLGLEVHGSIGLLLWTVASGLVENRKQAHQLLSGLNRSSLWISEHVVKAAAKAIDELTSE